MATLHPSVQQAIREEGQGDERANVMMSTHGTLNAEQRGVLESLGCRVRSVAGDVVTLDLPRRALAALGDLDFARYVELSRPLWPEKQDKE